MEGLIEDRRGHEAQAICSPRWDVLSGTYRSRAFLCEEPTGGFVAYASRLPGVVSQGESEEEALANLADAYRLALQEYTESGQQIPWAEVEIDQDSVERWIVVDV